MQIVFLFVVLLASCFQTTVARTVFPEKEDSQIQAVSATRNGGAYLIVIYQLFSVFDNKVNIAA